jgi:hypothetical protein
MPSRQGPAKGRPITHGTRDGRAARRQTMHTRLCHQDQAITASHKQSGGAMLQATDPSPERLGAQLRQALPPAPLHFEIAHLQILRPVAAAGRWEAMGWCLDKRRRRPTFLQAQVWSNRSTRCGGAGGTQAPVTTGTHKRRLKGSHARGPGTRPYWGNRTYEVQARARAVGWRRSRRVHNITLAPRPSWRAHLRATHPYGAAPATGPGCAGARCLPHGRRALQRGCAHASGGPRRSRRAHAGHGCLPAQVRECGH